MAHETTDRPDEDAVPPDDTTATTPLGVGESMSRGGENVTDKPDPDSRDEARSHRGTGAGPPAEDVTGINP